MYTNYALWHLFEKPCSSETHTVIPNSRHKHQTKVWGDRHTAAAALRPAHSTVTCPAPPSWLPRFETSFYPLGHTHLFCLLPASVKNCTGPQGSAPTPLFPLNSPPFSEVRYTSVSSAIAYIRKLLRGFFTGCWKVKGMSGPYPAPLVPQFSAELNCKCSTSESHPWL